MNTLHPDQQDAIESARDYLKAVADLLNPDPDLGVVDRGELSGLIGHLVRRLAPSFTGHEAEQARCCLTTVSYLIDRGDGSIERDDLSILLGYLIGLLDAALNMQPNS